MNRDVFLSILSMDSYNRDGGGLDLADDVDLGEADYISAGSSPSTGFSASNYTWMDGGAEKTVISYRGTNFTWPVLLDDALNGWVNGAGALGGQLADATAYYTAVTGSTLTSGARSDVILVGHSLGAGLAGFVGYTAGTEAYVVDTMPYWQSAAAWHFFHGRTLPGASTIRSAYIADEALVAVRATSSSDTLGAIYGPLGSLISPGAEFIKSLAPAAQVLDPHGTRPAVLLNLDFHSIGLEVILQYADNPGYSPLHVDWHSNGQALIDALFDNRIAHAATDGSAKGRQDASIMQQEIAYSAIESGERLFGDTGIRAMFDDADQIGGVFTSSSSVREFSYSLTGALVQFAGHLAARDIERWLTPGVLNGVVKIASWVSPDNMLRVSFADALWDEASGGTGTKPQASPTRRVGDDDFREASRRHFSLWSERVGSCAPC